MLGKVCHQSWEERGLTTNSAAATRSPRFTAGQLAWPGIIGPGLFVLVFVIVGLIKPGYDPVVRMVSEGSIGQLGWIQMVNFFVLGLALLVFALGLWRGFGDRISGRIGSVLMAVAGGGVFCAGIFVADPYPQISTIHGALHVAVSLVSFNSLALAAFFFAKRFWKNRAFAVYCIVSGIVPFGMAPPITIPSYAGLEQRAVIVLVFLWITILALRLRGAASLR